MWEEKFTLLKVSLFPIYFILIFCIDQWAQITLDLNYGQQYAIFERRLCDRTSFHDWKLFLLLTKEDFQFIHEPYSNFETKKGQVTQEGTYFSIKLILEMQDDFEEEIRSKHKQRKQLYV